MHRQSYEGFWLISTVQTPVTSVHCFLSHQLSTCQSKLDCRTWLLFWHTLSQMILIMSDILSEPLLSPLGKPCPQRPIYILREWEIMDIKTGRYKKKNCLKLIFKFNYIKNFKDDSQMTMNWFSNTGDVIFNLHWIVRICNFLVTPQCPFL